MNNYFHYLKDQSDIFKISSLVQPTVQNPKQHILIFKKLEPVNVVTRLNLIWETEESFFYYYYL